MKIGAFAKKYDINPSAVRFYVDKALITPKRENGQNVFDDTCCGQMEKILKYKHFRFTLEEIERIFYYENLSNLKDNRVINEIVGILMQKKALIEQEIVITNAVINDINEEINYYKKILNQGTAIQNTYVPLESFNILCCPACGKDLLLENASLEADGIKEADVKCDCGYSVTIKDGILLCQGYTEESPLRLFENDEGIIATTRDFSRSYRELLGKSHLRIYQQIMHDCKSCRNILVGPLTYNFILRYTNKIINGTTVVIVDPSLSKIREIKKYLSDSGKQILFIAGDINRIPMRKEIIDLYIDDFSFDNCAISYNMNIFEAIAPFLKDGGKVIGHFVNCSKAPKSLKNIKTDYPDFNPEMLSMNKTYASIADAGLKITEKTNLGSPKGKDSNYTRQVDDEKITLITYIAEKK